MYRFLLAAMSLLFCRGSYATTLDAPRQLAIAWVAGDTKTTSQAITAGSKVTWQYENDYDSQPIRYDFEMTDVVCSVTVRVETLEVLEGACRVR